MEQQPPKQETRLTVPHRGGGWRAVASRVGRGLRFGLLGQPAPGRLPDRVRRALTREQADSEIVVSWVQVFVVLSWATLYAVAPKTAPVDAPFQPVPITLTIYGIFIAFRLLLAYRRRLTGPILALSIIMDMSVLMLTIWSFHLQYHQPPAFYLKAPTLLYVFIFIALRTLRFEAVWVVLTGVVAALGWLILVAYAAWEGAETMPITHDYVRYMTSSSILLGAEFDKIISILMVTALLAIALMRVKGVLVRSVTGQLVVDDLSRFVARDVADRIASADAAVRPGQGEPRAAAAMFIDMRGFTPLARQLAPNALMDLLGDYQRRFVPVVQRHGGAVDKFLGDGIMVSFGATLPSKAYAADALRAMQDVLAEAENWRQARLAAGLPAPPVGVAVAAGPVIFGAVGDETRLEYTVIGDAVNLAAKLEKHTKVEGVAGLAPLDVLALARTQGYDPPRDFEVRRARRVIGVDAPLDLVVLTA